MNQLIEYMKIHLISIEQDIEEVVQQMEGLDIDCKDYKELEFEYNHLESQALVTRHYLSVANGILDEKGE